MIEVAFAPSRRDRGAKDLSSLRDLEGDSGSLGNPALKGWAGYSTSLPGRHQTDMPVATKKRTLPS